MNSEQYLTVGEVMKRLDISKVRMSQWIKDGTIKTEPSPYDKRVKLIPISEVERLKALPRPAKNRALAA